MKFQYQGMFLMRSPFYCSCHCILPCFVQKLTGIKSIFQTFSNFSFAAVTTNMRPRRGFFLSVETWVFVDINQLFPQFSHALWQSKVRSSLNEGRRLSRLPRIISIDDSVFNYFIKMKDYIVKTTRSLRAGGNIRNTLWSLRKGFQVVYLFDCLKNTGVVDGLPRGRNSKKQRYDTDKGKKIPLNGGCFRKWISF